jgi:asparagine synthase (glutamine-hydrolysing)
VPAISPILNLISGSRNSSFSNKIRQIKRFSEAVKLSPKHRYMSWACISSQTETNSLFKTNPAANFDAIFEESFLQQKFNPVNYADLKIVLADDMLVKADRMSMQHGLEIRNPFLDYRIVEMAMNLPMHQKINADGQKVILRNNFRQLLPEAIFTRSKKGFELPLWKWLKNELKTEIDNKWLSQATIEEQNLFNYERINELKQKLYSTNPGDAPAQIWALIVFQNWYANFKPFIKPNA